MPPMGSVSHPRLYDPAMMVTIKAAFYDVWDAIHVHTPSRDHAYDDDIRAEIIRRLLDLVADGTTDRDELKTQVIKSLANPRTTLGSASTDIPRRSARRVWP
jgi:hypothetical protein